MPEETAELTREDFKPANGKRQQEQTDPDVLKLLGSWRTKATHLYLSAKIGASVVICAKAKVSELIQDGENGFVLYLADQGFDDEYEPPSQYQPARIGFCYLWRTQLRDFRITNSGSVLTLHADALDIQLSERLLRPVGDSYYGDGRIMEWWG